MSGTRQLERWALERAHKIMLHEGMNLMNAAQWLDKKQTIRSSQALRDAIKQSLIEAVTLQESIALPEEVAETHRFSPNSTSTLTATIDPT